MNLSAARIFVRDIAEAKNFYANDLGLVVETYDSVHGVCIFDTGSTKLIVESVAADAPEDEQILVGRFTGLSFPVEDIALKHRQLLAAGVKFTAVPERQFWGGWLATFEDPSSNEIQLVQHAA